VACSCCVRSIRVRQLLSLGVCHPEDLLNVVGHVLKPLLARLKQRLSSRAFGNVAHDKEVPVREVVPGRSEIDDQLRSISRNQTRASWFLLGAEQKEAQPSANPDESDNGRGSLSAGQHIT
jgi:hypothetical protein